MGLCLFSQRASDRQEDTAAPGKVQEEFPNGKVCQALEWADREMVES